MDIDDYLLSCGTILICYQTTLGGIEEEAKAGLGDKNPSVKSETSLFLSRCFQQCSPDMMPKGLLKAFCPLLVQVIPLYTYVCTVALNIFVRTCTYIRMYICTCLIMYII